MVWICHKQKLDYLGLPFRCNFCRSTSHLRRDCNGIKEEEEFSEEQDFPYSLPDSSMDTGFYGFEGSRVDRINKIFLEPTDSTIGKLQMFCPTFCNSLSVLECLLVSSSIWLKNSISKPFGPPLKVSEVSQKSAHSERINSLLSHPYLVTSPLERVDPSVVLLLEKDIASSGISSLEPSFSLETCNSQDNSHLLSVNQPFPPGYREPEEDDPTVSAVLDSFLPFLRGSKALVPIPTFLGKKPIELGVESGQASTSGISVAKGGKEFAWSWGLGIELSPVKTHSARKKSSTELKDDYAPILPSDGKALRDLKALARTK
jgi:hypothetical protein